MSEPSIARGMRPNRHPLDEDSASRLLQGLVHPDDAPPGYGAVAGLLHSAAQLPLGPVDEDAAATTVSAMVEAIRDATPAPQPSRRKTMLGKLLAGKALAAVAVLGLTATGAAAATGSLPDPAQGVVSDVVSHVGVNVPHPNHGKSADHRQDGKDHQDGDDNGQSGDQNGQPGDQNNGLSDFVHTTKDTLPDGAKLGPIVCAKASDNHCQAGVNHGQGDGTDDQGTPPSSDDQSGQHGKSGEEHPAANEHATTPTTGSIATGVDHSSHSEPPVGSGKPE
jgi:hypothetical protein